MLKIMGYLGDVSGSGWIRMMLPFHYLRKSGKYECRVSMLINPEKISWQPDVIVMSRQHKPEVRYFIEDWVSKGKNVILDFDDQLLNLSPANPAFSIFQGVKGDVIKCIKAASSITVSTQPLKEVYSRFHDKITVLSNCANPEFMRTKHKNNTGKIRIIWAGSNTHEEDLHYVSDALIKIAEKYDNIKIVMFGYSPDYITNRVPKEKFEYHEGVNIDHYHKKLGELSPDIGLAPLKDNEFNRCKSNIKILEYGILGAPTIASPVYPYTNTIKDRTDGMIVKKNRFKNWVKSLEYLIENEKERKMMGAFARKLVLERYNIELNINRWERAYGLI